MRTELLRFNGAVERDPAIDAWMKEHAGELGAIAHQWFEVMRKCGDEVRELGCEPLVVFSDRGRITHHPEVDPAFRIGLPRAAVFTNSSPLDKMWASRPLGRRGQALGEVNDGESGQQGRNQTDSQKGYQTV